MTFLEFCFITHNKAHNCVPRTTLVIKSKLFGIGNELLCGISTPQALFHKHPIFLFIHKNLDEVELHSQNKKTLVLPHQYYHDHIRTLGNATEIRRWYKAEFFFISYFVGICHASKLPLELHKSIFCFTFYNILIFYYVHSSTVTACRLLRSD